MTGRAIHQRAVRHDELEEAGGPAPFAGEAEVKRELRCIGRALLARPPAHPTPLMAAGAQVKITLAATVRLGRRGEHRVAPVASHRVRGAKIKRGELLTASTVSGH